MPLQSLDLLPATDAAPAVVEYVGICEASASVALDDIHFVVASDELNTFQIYRRGVPRPVRSRPFKDFLDADSSDIEAAARIGDRVYWISSFSRSKEDGNARDRSVLFATRIVHTADGPTLEPLGKPFEKLRRYLKRELDLPGTHIDIEGLAGSPEGNLLIGFRGPLLEDGTAPVLRLVNPIAVTELAAKPIFGMLQKLDLGKRGIRSIDWTGLSPSAYLIVAGPGTDGERPDDGAAKFLLYSWNGTDPKPKRLQVTLPETFTAEALVLYPERGLVQVLSDDGKKKSERKIPKHKRRFRSFDVAY